MRARNTETPLFTDSQLMIRSLPIFLLFSLIHGIVVAQNGFPYQSETLRYTVNWPSGLSLGDANMRAQKGTDRWEFDFTIDAGIPGFAVNDHYHSVVTAQLCTLQFDKNTVHGPRKAREKTVIDPAKSIATRTTEGGGKSEFPVPPCVKDALAYLYYTRRELSQGRVPPPPTVLSGAVYQVRLEYTGLQTVRVNEVPTQADRVVAHVKGPKSESNFEMFFARDAARTPLVIRVPFALGTFSMELVR